jgi:ABC-type branched-subunit amino acid transport system substrate-binding protein
MYKMGLIAPQSNFLPQLSRNFRDSLKLGLGKALDNIELCVQAGGYMSRERDISSAIQKLIIEDDVELIILALNPASLIDLNNLIESEGVPVIVCTLGENLIPSNAVNKFTHFNSFHLWQCGWMLGFEAVKRFGSRVTLACSFKDGGYGISAAVDLGTVSAGGVLVNNLVSRRRVQDDKPFIEVNKLTEVETDVIVANYSGQEAVEFINNVKSTSALESVPLMSLPMGVEQEILQAVGNDGTGVMSISTWDRSAEISEPYLLADSIAVKQPPNFYSLLAYESGMLIAAALVISESQTLSLNDALHTCQINGPRGETELFSANPTPDSRLEFTLSSTQQGTETVANNNCLERLESPDSCYQQMQQLSQSEHYTGWINPYLIA